MKSILSVLLILIMVFIISACGESDYSWQPDSEINSSRSSDITEHSGSAANSNSKSTYKSKDETTATTGTPLSKEEEAELKDEMNDILDELMGEE